MVALRIQTPEDGADEPNPWDVKCSPSSVSLPLGTQMPDGGVRSSSTQARIRSRSREGISAPMGGLQSMTLLTKSVATQITSDPARTLPQESVVVVWAAFSPVRAVSVLHLPDPMQHVRNACGRNPYVPRVPSDRDAYIAKRRCADSSIPTGARSVKSVVLDGLMRHRRKAQSTPVAAEHTACRLKGSLQRFGEFL